MNHNCKNCGAPVQPNQCACPWCNTPYGYTKNTDEFDIDFNKFLYLTKLNQEMAERKEVLDLEKELDGVHVLYADDVPIMIVK